MSPTQPENTFRQLFFYTAHAVVLTKLSTVLFEPLQPERAILAVWSPGVALRTGQSGASEAAELHVHFLSINLIDIRRPRDIVLVMASSARGIDSTGRQ